jgi:tetratricopeptide (TPR) repeat protein
MLPFVLFAGDRLVLGGTPAEKRWRLRVHVPLMTLCVIGAGARAWLYQHVEYASAAHWGWRRGLVEFDVAARYLGLLAVPWSQSLVHAVNPITSMVDLRIGLALGILGLIAWAGSAMRQRQPLVPFGIYWFLLLLVPSAALAVLSDGGELMAEHRVYLASCGLFTAAGSLAAALLERLEGVSARKGAYGAFGAIVAVLLLLTIARNNTWSDPVTLWEDAASHAPTTYIAQYGVGDAYRSTGDCESALPWYQRAVPLEPQLIDAYIGEATCLGELGRLDEATVALRQGIAMARLDPRPLVLLARLEAARGNPAEARRACEEVLQMQPATAFAAECQRRTLQR